MSTITAATLAISSVSLLVTVITLQVLLHWFITERTPEAPPRPPTPPPSPTPSIPPLETPESQRSPSPITFVAVPASGWSTRSNSPDNSGWGPTPIQINVTTTVETDAPSALDNWLNPSRANGGWGTPRSLSPTEPISDDDNNWPPISEWNNPNWQAPIPSVAPLNITPRRREYTPMVISPIPWNPVLDPNPPYRTPRVKVRGPRLPTMQEAIIKRRKAAEEAGSLAVQHTGWTDTPDTPWN